MREEKYQLKYQKLINFRLSSLCEFIEKHKDTRDSDVDLQLAVVEGNGERDVLRLELLRKIVSASEKAEMTRGLTFYSSSE